MKNNYTFSSYQDINTIMGFYDYLKYTIAENLFLKSVNEISLENPMLFVQNVYVGPLRVRQVEPI